MFKKVKNFLMTDVTVPEWVWLIMAFFFGYGIASMTEDITGTIRKHLRHGKR